MSHRRSKAPRRALLAVAGLAAALTLAPASAGAATTTVQVGGSENAALAYEPNNFFNRSVTIHPGDSVKFIVKSFHTVTFPKRGQVIPFAIPTGKLVAGVNDAAGNPFWYDSKAPQLMVNPLAAAPTKNRVENGKALVNSGFPPDQGKPKPFVVRFPKAGTYHFLCTIHSNMNGVVHVVAARKHVPSAKAVGASRRAALARSLQLAKTLSTGPANLPANTIQAGNDGPRGEAIFKFFPANLTVPVGTTVTLQMSPLTREAHTFAFGPAQTGGYLETVANNLITPDLLLSAQALYPSEPPAAVPPTLDPTTHGNGFLSTGFLDADPSTPSGFRSQVTFSTPGTYNYICLIHPFMHGTVTVTPAA